MSYLYIIILSVVSIIVLFFLTRLIGHRQMSELSMFDYICGITIGSIAAEMATALEDFMEPLIAMITISLVTYLLSLLSSKSMKVRMFLSGSPNILFHNDQIYEENFKKGHIDLSEFLTQCRLNGFYDLSQIQTAILEENGRISFLPKAQNRPATPSDLGQTPQEETIVPTYVMDGKLLKKNLKHSGKDETWLNNQLKAHGCSRLTDALLVTGNQNNGINVYLKNRDTGKSVIKE